MYSKFKEDNMADKLDLSKYIGRRQVVVPR